MLGEFCTEVGLCDSCWASFVPKWPGTVLVGRVLFRRVAPLMVQFPPFGGGEAASQAGVVPTVQTTSVKNADNGVLWAKWSTFWAQRCLSWRVVRM